MGISVGSAEIFDCGLYPETPRTFTNYLQSKVNSLASMGLGLSQQFMDMTQSLYKKHNDEALLAAARNAALASNMLFDMNVIQALLTLVQLQNAKPLMQRFIMAMPEATKLMNQQRIDAYSGSFVDMENGAVGIDRRDYRLVTDGLITENEDGSTSWKWHYGDEDEDDVQLTWRQKNDILDTWHEVGNAIAQGKDFSDTLGGEING